MVGRAWQRVVLGLASLGLLQVACNLPALGGDRGLDLPTPTVAEVAPTEPAIQATAAPALDLTAVLPLVTPSPTFGAILIVPSNTPIPTLGLVIVADVVHASGTDLTLDHDEYVDLDSGDLGLRLGSAAEFQMTTIDDPYLDALVPLNGSYIGWYGAGPHPGKQGCIDSLMAVAPMPLNWPDNKDTYYCYLTSENHYGWLKALTYVSQPFHERRLIFDFTTYE